MYIWNIQLQVTTNNPSNKTVANIPIGSHVIPIIIELTNDASMRHWRTKLGQRGDLAGRLPGGFLTLSNKNLPTINHFVFITALT